MPSSDNYEWIYYESARRGAKYHLFEDGKPMSVCGCADRRRASTGLSAGPDSKVCVFCNSFARRHGVDR